MAFVVEKRCKRTVCALPDEKERPIDKLQRKFCELEQRVHKYFDDLDDVEEMCIQAREDVKQFQLIAKMEKETVKKDAEIQATPFSALTEKNNNMKKTKEKDASPSQDKMSEAGKSALRCTTSGRVCRFIRIGCALMFTAYQLFKITQPYFF